MEERTVEENSSPEELVFEPRKISVTATCEHNWYVDEFGTIPHWVCNKCGIGKYSPINPKELPAS